MSDTGFAPPADPERLAVPYADDTPQPHRMGDPDSVVGSDGRTIHFSPGRIFNPRAFHSGGGGAVGTADNIFAFLEAIRNRGTPILKHETAALAIQNQIGDIPRAERDAGQRFGFLGAVIADPQAAGRPHAPGTIRWGGVYGHDWFVDFTNGITAVLMTNTAIEGSGGNYPKAMRNAIYDV
jgi:CubicO group peptidase (beta-lactamase class C family)